MAARKKPNTRSSAARLVASDAPAKKTPGKATTTKKSKTRSPFRTHATTSTPLPPLQAALEDTRNTLYDVFNSTVNFKNPETVMHTVESYVASLPALSEALPADDTTSFPWEAIPVYVDSMWNPDIYTRDMLRGFQLRQQHIVPVMEAWGDFFDILAKEVEEGLPELSGEVKKIRDAMPKEP